MPSLKAFKFFIPLSLIAVNIGLKAASIAFAGSIYFLSASLNNPNVRSMLFHHFAIPLN